MFKELNKLLFIFIKVFIEYKSINKIIEFNKIVHNFYTLKEIIDIPFIEFLNLFICLYFILFQIFFFFF